MKTYLNLLVIALIVSFTSYGQTAQFTLKASGATTMQVYAKLSANVTPVTGISTLTFVLQIPTSYGNPQGNWGVVSNGTYLGAFSSQTATSALTGAKYNTVFSWSSNPNINGTTLTANTEYLMATITVPAGVALQDVTLIDWGNNRLENAVFGAPVWATSLAIDGSFLENTASIYYQSSTSQAPSNSGTVTLQSTIALTGTPLGIHLLSFAGKLNNGISNLQWTVEKETATGKYEVEYGTDGINWSKAGEVISLHKEASHTYFFTHDSRQSLGAVYYRLQTISLQGSSEYSEVIRLSFSGSVDGGGYKVYPTVLQAGANITVVTPTDDTDNMIRIKDQQGRLVKEMRAANKTIVVPTSGFAPGMYYLQVVENNSVQVTAKLVVN